MSKVYKASYYPQGSALNAKLGSNPSYIWRSIVESQSIVKQGLSCRIGNGRSVSIKGDPWLLNSEESYIHSNSEALQN